MTKQASTPPTRDKGAPTAPPPPPRWRHYLWLIALALFVLLLFVVPATRSTSSVTLDYSQFLNDVSAHKVKSVSISTNGSASGTLTDGSHYKTVIPPQAGEQFLSQLQTAGVQVSAKTSGTSFGAEVLVVAHPSSALPRPRLLVVAAVEGGRGKVAGGAPGGPNQRQGLRRGSSHDQVHRRCRLRRGEARDPGGGGLPPALRSVRPRWGHGAGGC